MTKSAWRYSPNSRADCGPHSNRCEQIESGSYPFAEPDPEKGNSMKAKDLDKIFDDGNVDITDYLDLSQAFRTGHEQKRVNVDFPT